MNRNCLTRSRILTAKCNHRSLRTSPRTRPRAVKQLSNDKLLDLIQEGKEKAGDPSPSHAPSKLESVASINHDHVVQRRPRAAPQSLPQSPLTDPRLSAARARYKAEKPHSSQERSAFQLKLQKNPYGTARALSTPPRLCLLTGSRLPSHFLIPFGVSRHPITGAPWRLPKLLDNTSNPNEGVAPSSSEPPLPKPESDPNPDPDLGFESEVASNIRTATGTHFVASREALAHISNLSESGYRKLIPYRWKEDPSIKVSEIVWREDMDVFVLEILRKNITNELIYLTSRPAAYIAACKDAESIANHNQVGAVLWLGEPSSQCAPSDKTAKAIKQSPPIHAMYYYKSQYVPYYNLPLLLGPLHVQTLRQNRPAHFDAQIAVIKAKKMTTNIQLDIWKLMGYLS